MDKARILSKLSELDKYLEELDEIMPQDYELYESNIEKKRACERILQISIESVIDICNIIASGLKISIPSDEDDLIKGLLDKKILTIKTGEIISKMKGFRNILVHKYGTVDNELVFEFLSNELDDFERFKQEVLKSINASK